MIKHACIAVNKKIPKAFRQADFDDIVSTEFSQYSQDYVPGFSQDYIPGLNDLPGSGDFIVVPLQMGSGKYKVTLYENTSGKKYAAAGSVTIKAKLTREDGAFLYPNQYVDYDEATKAVAYADKLCAGMSPKEAFNAVCTHMKTFSYDYIKAINIKAGMLPDIPGTWDKRMGVCQDLAAIMCCMLRTQGLPARLVIGYADKGYHAWTVTEINGEDAFYDPTAALNAISKPKKYTVERFY